MNIKDILIALAVRDECDPARDFALSMAKTFEAHVSAVGYALTPLMPFSFYPAFIAQIANQASAEAKKAVEAARVRLEDAAKKFGLTCEFHNLSASVQTGAADFAMRARTSDVAILTQHKPEELERVGDVFAEAALFQSGRPVILVPRGYSRPYSVERALIAWDGSIHATRAVAAAMPLLKGAEVKVFTVEETPKGSDFRGNRLVEHLQRHGLDASIAQSSEPNIPEAILSEAELFKASLVVMGGYGHSRFREFMFGGATSLMLTNATVPVLMAH